MVSSLKLKSQITVSMLLGLFTKFEEIVCSSGTYQFVNDLNYPVFNSFDNIQLSTA